MTFAHITQTSSSNATGSPEKSFPRPIPSPCCSHSQVILKSCIMCLYHLVSLFSSKFPKSGLESRNSVKYKPDPVFDPVFRLRPWVHLYSWLCYFETRKCYTCRHCNLFTTINCFQIRCHQFLPDFIYWFDITLL